VVVEQGQSAEDIGRRWKQRASSGTATSSNLSGVDRLGGSLEAGSTVRARHTGDEWRSVASRQGALLRAR
jgi:hypothetical protein